MMIPPDSNHDVPLDGFDVHGASDYIVQPTVFTASNQVLPLVSQDRPSSASANVNSIGVSGVDVLHSSSGGVDGAGRILPGIDSRVGRVSSSNTKSSKKKNAYYHRRSGEKKERLIWTPELHQCFLEFYNQFPSEKRVPKKILEEMRRTYPYITRENVASHLQKHRLYLKHSKNKEKNKEMGNPAKSSSKSVPLKLTKQESNFHQIPNNTAISTCPNAVQFPHQSPSISTNPNSQLPLQSHSITTTHNSQLALQAYTLHETSQNQVFSQFDETHLLDQDTVHALLDIGWDDVSIYSNMTNALESQSNPFGRQSSNAASCFPVRVNHFPTPVPSNHQLLMSNIDANGNSFYPMMGNSFGVSRSNNYSLGALPNFFDYNMNSNLNNVQIDAMNNTYSLGSYSDTLQLDYPMNLNVQNGLQPQDFDQAVQSMFYPPAPHLLDYASTLPHNFGSGHLN